MIMPEYIKLQIWWDMSARAILGPVKLQIHGQTKNIKTETKCIK